MSTQASLVYQYRPWLLVYIVWHPEFERGRELAELVYAHLTRDPKNPNSRGIGIPVYYRSAPAADATIPAPIGFDDAVHTAVVVLVDPRMLLNAADGWGAYVTDIWQQARDHPQRHRIFPVAFHDRAYALSPEIAQMNFIRLQDLAPAAGEKKLLNTLSNELGRLLTRRPSLANLDESGTAPDSPTPMRLFISHAKLDGESTAVALRDYVHKNLALDTFFDEIDIAVGYSFKDEIDTAIDRTAFVVVQTDAYVSRVWCQYEIVRAKRKGRPVVVINAIEEGEARSFPYIGNVPTVRWRPNDTGRIEAVVGLLLREILRSEYFSQHFENLKTLFGASEKVRALPRAPELLTCLALRVDSATVPYFVYPDPPLAKLELDLLAELDPHLRLTTPTLLFVNHTEPASAVAGGLERAAAGWNIGLSISDSPDLAARGFGAAHLRDAASEFARFFLAADASIAYGGNLRQGGFSEVLFDLLNAYRASTGEETDVISSYLAWPLSLDLTDEQRLQLMSTARFIKIPPPPDLGVDPTTKIPSSTPEERWIWARCLTEMRQRMNRDVHARLFLGGPPQSRGKYPGLVEEALYALRSGKPVFLVGAFGGCAEILIQAVCGKKPKALTLEYQSALPENAAAIAYYNEKAGGNVEPIDYIALVAFLESVGIAGLHNGLNEGENRRLFSTTHLSEMIALVLRGLRRLGPPPKLGESMPG